MTLKDLAKTVARGIATCVVLPMIASYWIRARIIGRDRALQGSTQLLGVVPGIPGQYLRRAFLAHALHRCAVSATIEFGTLLSQAGACIDENVYIGSHCHLGLVHLERDVLVASGVHIPSGPYGHGMDVSLPIRDQSGSLRMIQIGAGSWIGSAAIIMADVGRDSIVGAGAVVTRPLPDGVVAAGVPARVVRVRTRLGARPA